jgi:hypothetical protein
MAASEGARFGHVILTGPDYARDPANNLTELQAWT